MLYNAFLQSLFKMFNSSLIVISLIFVSQVFCNPLDQNSKRLQGNNVHRTLRSVHGPSFVAEESLINNLFTKIRTRRSTEEECEKLALCKLHANSQHSFIDTFELYFVNKENAHLWDHRSHTVADCERIFAGCSGRAESKPASKEHEAPRGQRRQFRADYSDEDYY